MRSWSLYKTLCFLKRHVNYTFKIQHQLSFFLYMYNLLALCLTPSGRKKESQYWRKKVPRLGWTWCVPGALWYLTPSEQRGKSCFDNFSVRHTWKILPIKADCQHHFSLLLSHPILFPHAPCDSLISSESPKFCQGFCCASNLFALWSMKRISFKTNIQRWAFIHIHIHLSWWRPYHVSKISGIIA